MASKAGRPSVALTLEVIQRGPMATSRKKWAAVAKYRSINADRVRKGFLEISTSDFSEWTGISEADISNAEANKEFVEVALSIAKGKSLLWFRDMLPKIQEAAERLNAEGKDKEFVNISLTLAEMFKFKDTDFSGMEEAESKDNKETVEEIIAILKDDAVLKAITNEEGLVAQKIIPALINASFKPGTKQQILTPSQLDNQPKADSPDGPNQSVAPVQEAGDRTLQ